MTNYSEQTVEDSRPVESARKETSRTKKILSLGSCVLLISLTFQYLTYVKNGFVSLSQPVETHELASQARPEAFDVDFISIRMGEPVVLRGPFKDEGDSYLSQMKLENGFFRSFSANSSTYAIDSSHSWNIGGARKLVLSNGVRTDASDCGRWLNSIVKSLPGQPPKRWFGLVHNETACDYNARPIQTHKSMSLYVSDDEGLSWSNWGTILSRDIPQPNLITGDGDCTFVHPFDGFLYAYCLHWPAGVTFVARAPTWSLGPGNWFKFNYGEWRSAGLNGGATPLAGNPGASAFFWKPFNRIGLLFGSHLFGGIRLSIGRSEGGRVEFSSLKDPLVHYMENGWERNPNAPALYGYENVLNPFDGENAVDNHFYLWYSYIPPGEAESQRYKVLQTVTVRYLNHRPHFQVGSSLTQWIQPSSGRMRTTTLPVLGGGSAWTKGERLGYVLTRQPDHAQSVRLEECRIDYGSFYDDLIVAAGSCGDSKKLGSIGWIFQERLPSTAPLYRCFNSSLSFHFASNSENCDGRGRVEFLMGYIPQD